MSSELKQLADEEVVGLYRAGREDAFDELYSRYAARLKSLIYHTLGDAEATDDVFHDVFLRVYRHLGTYNASKPFSSWIYQIAVNCARNYRRRHVRNDMIIEMEKASARERDESVSPEDEFIREAEMVEFSGAVGALKKSFREVFVLRVEQKMKYRDIAEILGCSERTAKWRMRKAVEHIADRLKKRGVL